MKKKKHRQKDKKHERSTDSKKPSSVELSDPDKNDTFDFGGLPQRDLKKNLGCG